jgi:hypothetical protein
MLLRLLLPRRCCAASQQPCMLLVLATMVLLPLLFATAAAAAAAEGPCDILDAAGNPCVAAHSTTRALYAKYDGPLYNVTRSSDGTSMSVGLLAAGGFADKKAHDAFCAKLDCVISNVFDQSPQKNHLGQRHKLINASRHSVTVGKAKTPVYGMWFDPGFGYHVDNTTGIATGNNPESIYAVMSGKNYNGGCCFVSKPARLRRPTRLAETLINSWLPRARRLLAPCAGLRQLRDGRSRRRRWRDGGDL